MKFEGVEWSASLDDENHESPITVFLPSLLERDGASFLSVLFRSFVRFSTPAAGQPASHTLHPLRRGARRAGEGGRGGGVIAIKHRKPAKLRCNLAR